MMTKVKWKQFNHDVRTARSIQNLPGHGHARHGSQTTLNQQIIRVQTGNAPDGAKAPTNRATRFDNPELELEAVGRARRVLDKREAAGKVPYTVTTRKGRVIPHTEEIVVGGRSGGYGSGIEVQRGKDGKVLAGRPIQATGQDLHALVRFVWHSPANRWEPNTQFPTNISTTLP